MATLLTLDPRLPIPDSLAIDDPAHPLNIMKVAREIQAQAAADAQYDVAVQRKKVEGFRSPFQGPGDTSHQGKSEPRSSKAGRGDFAMAVGLLVLVLFIGLAVRNTLRSLYTFVILLGFAAMFLIHKKAFDN